MSGTVDVLNPDKPKRVLMLASDPAVTEQTGWPIGFWWAEFTHPCWEFLEHGYEVDVASPEGGKLEGDNWSDPRDTSKYSADDLISLGFISSPEAREARCRDEAPRRGPGRRLRRTAGDRRAGADVHVPPKTRSSSSRR